MENTKTVQEARNLKPTISYLEKEVPAFTETVFEDFFWEQGL